MIKEAFHYLMLGYRTRRSLRECQDILKKTCNNNYESIEPYLESGNIGEATRYLVRFDHGGRLSSAQETIIRRKLLKIAIEHKMRDQVIQLKGMLNE